MKKNKLFLCALASGMLALTGCSDSTDFTESKGAQWNADGTGYISLAINLPQTNDSGMRANGAGNSDNDKFNDGKPSEYAVSDALLVLFTGAAADAEAAYKFEAAYKLPLNLQQQVPTADQITSTAKITKKIESIEAGKQIKALVILNPGSYIKCNNTMDIEDASNNTLTVNTKEYTKTATDNTFKDFCAEYAAVNTDLSKGKFMMTNAPLVSAPSVAGTTAPAGNVTTLANVDVTKIFQTAAEASATPASTIYVERSVAKVTLDKSGFNPTVKYNGDLAIGTLPKITCVITGFELDNTNPNTFLVRNSAGYENWQGLASTGVNDDLVTRYRFNGNLDVQYNTGLTSGLYRTYFAKDINYDVDVATLATDAYNKLDTKTTINFGSDLAAPRYCMENTFDVANQKHKNTTRAVLKVKYTVGGVSTNEDLYMINHDATTFKTLADFKALIEEKLANRDAINTLTPAVAGVAPTVTVNNIVPAEDGYVKVQTFTIDGIEGGPKTVTESDALYSEVQALGLDHIAKYTRGEGYYIVNIQHFGETLTPWNSTEKSTTFTPTANAPYYEGATVTDLATQNYLGRYGVLRNNWYDLNVTAVNRVGTPNIPVPGNEWDDDLDSYISVKINILSWAVRRQGVVLQ